MKKHFVAVLSETAPRRFDDHAPCRRRSHLRVVAVRSRTSASVVTVAPSLPPTRQSVVLLSYRVWVGFGLLVSSELGTRLAQEGHPTSGVRAKNRDPQHCTSYSDLSACEVERDQVGINSIMIPTLSFDEENTKRARTFPWRPGVLVLRWASSSRCCWRDRAMAKARFAASSSMEGLGRMKIYI